MNEISKILLYILFHNFIFLIILLIVGLLGLIALKWYLTNKAINVYAYLPGMPLKIIN